MARDFSLGFEEDLDCSAAWPDIVRPKKLTDAQVRQRMLDFVESLVKHSPPGRVITITVHDRTKGWRHFTVDIDPFP